MKRYFLRSVFSIVLLLLTIKTKAQLVNVESQRIQSDSIRFVGLLDASFSYQKNNTDALSIFAFNLTSQYKLKSLKDYFLLIANSDYTATNKQQLSNSLMIHLRYSRRLTKLIKLESFMQHQKNLPLGILSRDLTGVGFRTKLLTVNNSKVYLGTLYMLELLKTITIPSNRQINNRLSAYLSFSVKLPNELGEFNSVTYYQPKLNEFLNYRISNQEVVNIKLVKKVFFSIIFSYSYDSKAPEGISKTSFNYSNGFKISI
jgi:hypothetical protein